MIISPLYSKLAHLTRYESALGLMKRVQLLHVKDIDLKDLLEQIRNKISPKTLLRSRKFWQNSQQ